MRKTVSLRRSEAVRFAWVSRDSEAARAGLRAGDVILSCNGLPTPNIAALHAALREAQGAVRIGIAFERDGERKGTVLIPAADLSRIPRYDPLPGIENVLLGR